MTNSCDRLTLYIDSYLLLPFQFEDLDLLSPTNNFLILTSVDQLLVKRHDWKEINNPKNKSYQQNSISIMRVNLTDTVKSNIS